MRRQEVSSSGADIAARPIAHQETVAFPGEPPPFTEFPKIARLSREVVITEKIDGTNGQVLVMEDGRVFAGSRSRWLPPGGDDNFGFGRWVAEHADELRQLGPGRHYGEWWGAGIQRRYGLSEKRFSLFNVSRWSDDRPACCGVVPVLWSGLFNTAAVDACLADLQANGSKAAPGFMKPEGVIVFHLAGNVGFKKTIERDEEPKALMARKALAAEPVAALSGVAAQVVNDGPGSAQAAEIADLSGDGGDWRNHPECP